MNWYWVYWGYMTFSLFTLFMTLAHGDRVFKRLNAAAVPVNDWPEAALIIPVTGNDGNLYITLSSFLNQDYPQYEINFVTTDVEDPASTVISELVRRRPNARLILAGRSESCGQKNYNLIAGVNNASPASKVLVFADAGHMAEPDWLKNLIRPLVSEKKPASSGYHVVQPINGDAGAWAKSIIVLMLSMARGLDAISQLWGGATAISRDLYISLGVEKLWSRAVVDDSTLSARLRENGLKHALAAGKPMITHLHTENWKSITTWMTRQWSYLKFTHRISWSLIGATGTIFTIGFLFLPILTLLAPGGISSDYKLTIIISLWVELFLFIYYLRSLHPAPPGIFKWTYAVSIALLATAWSHCLTWFTDSITWAGVNYQVKQGGRVIKVNRFDQAG